MIQHQPLTIKNNVQALGYDINGGDVSDFLPVKLLTSNDLNFASLHGFTA